MCVKRMQFYPTQWRCSRRVLIWIVVRIKQRNQQLNKRGIMIPLNGKKMSAYCPWSVNETVHRGHYAECCKEFLLVYPLRGANEQEWNDEMMNGGCTDGDGKWREVL